MKVLTSKIVCGVALCFVAIPLHAQLAPAPKVQQGPSDPFLKDTSRAIPGLPNQSVRTDSLLVVVEIYALPQMEGLRLLEGKADSRTRYQHVTELMKGGKARLTSLIAGAGRSGAQSLIQSNDEMRTPSRFAAPVAGSEIPVPADFENREIGDRLEMAPVLSFDGRECSLAMEVRTNRLLGFREHRPRENDAPLPSPDTEEQQIKTNTVLALGQPQFLGTMNRVGHTGGAEVAGATEVSLAFATVYLTEATAGNAEPTQASSAAYNTMLTVFSMDRGAARDVLAAQPQPGAYYAAVKTLVEKQQAKIERVGALPIAPGRRGILRENPDVRYPKAFSQTTQTPATKGGVVVAEGFARRLTGLSFEEELMIAPAGQCELNTRVQLGFHRGELQTGNLPVKYRQAPVFEQRLINTSVRGRTGEDIFLGTLNPPGDTNVNERKDSGRVWLAFVRLTPKEQKAE